MPMGRPPTCAHMVAMQRYVADHRHTGTNVPYPIDSLLGETPAVVLHLVVHQIPFSATTDGIYKCFVQEIPITWYNYNALLVLKMAIGGVFAQRAQSAGTARAQCAHSANYDRDYPGNSPKNHPPAESCTTNSNLKNSNI